MIFYMLWLADFAEKAQRGSGSLIVFCMFIFGLASFIFFVALSYPDRKEEKEELCNKYKKPFLSVIKINCVVIILSAVTYVALPSKNTVLIGLSGDYAVEQIKKAADSSVAQKAYSLLEKKLDEALAEQNKDKDKGAK